MNPEVFIFTTPTCKFCAMAKEYLTGRNIRFTEHDVQADKEKAAEIYRLTGENAVPVLIINGRVLVGFSRELVDDALSKPPLPKREHLLQNIIFDPFEK
jgi:glutaredoxin 3